MICWLLASALAADPEEFPLRAEVTLPAEGVARVRVPVELRSVADPVDGSDLLLVDGEGRPVPFARVEGDPGTRTPVQVKASATADPDVYLVDVGPLPVVELGVTLPDGVRAATVTVSAPDGATLAGPVVLFDLPDGRRLELDLPSRSGVVRVEVVPTRRPVGSGRPPSFQAWRRQTPPVAPDRLEIAVDGPYLQENGLVRYEAAIERALPIDRVTLLATDRIFERQAEIQAIPWNQSPDAWRGAELWATNPTTVRRVMFGELSAEIATLPGPATPTDRLALLVTAQGLPPLDVTGLAVELDGVELLVLDPGPGPHGLYGGAAVGTTPEWDLAVAGPELGRRAVEPVSTGPVVPNPAWIPPEVRANLAGPGPALELDRWRYKRPVSGAGLVRIGIPTEVLSSARPDLGDLRLERDGRQIPYVLRRSAADPVLEGTTVDRAERGGTSVLRVRLPREGLPVSSLTLRTDATLFERQVTVSRVRGTALDPLRAVSWVGRVRPMALTIPVAAAIGDELVVEIANGDDPPLPIDEVTVRAAGWELVAVLPEGGAALLYGAPSVASPSYDLDLLAAHLASRASAEASVGEREAVGRLALGALDRVLLAIGVGVLALGLLVLAADLVRRLPAEEPGTPR